MKIHNTFDVTKPIDQAWDLLTDIESIVSCMPGAELTESLADNCYKGRVSVKLGPVILTFDGMARFDEMDLVNHRARVSAQGSDKKGRGGATADIIFRLEPSDNRTKVLIDTDLVLSGSVAQYGRGSGMINELASQLVQQFADSLHRKISNSKLSGHEKKGRASESSMAAIPLLDLVWKTMWVKVVKAARIILGRA